MSLLTFKGNGFWDGGIISVVGTFAFYNVKMDTYFYVSMVYDRPSNSLLPPLLTITPFIPNVWTRQNASPMVISDVIRIILLFIVFFNAFQAFNVAKDNLHVTERDIFNIISLALQPKMLSTFILIIIYLFVFGYKLTYLMVDPSTYFQLNSELEYLAFQQNEFYSIVNIFERVIILETIIIIVLLARIVFLFIDIKRIKPFFLYIRNSFSNVATYFIIMFMFLIFFSIFANNLWGENYIDYASFGSSIMNTLLFSLGHCRKNIFNNSNIIIKKSSK